MSLGPFPAMWVTYRQDLSREIFPTSFLSITCRVEITKLLFVKHIKISEPPLCVAAKHEMAIHIVVSGVNSCRLQKSKYYSAELRKKL